MPRKAAPQPYPGVELGDSLYIHHPKHGPMAVKVCAKGQHGITGKDDKGRAHRVKWQHVLGAKQRISQQFSVVDQGEDGAILEDAQGERRFLKIGPQTQIEQEPQPKGKALATRRRPRMIKGLILFFKAAHRIGNALYAKTVVVDKHGVPRTVYRLSTHREPERAAERHHIEALYEYAKQHPLAPPQAVQLILGDQLKAILDKGPAISDKNGQIKVQGASVKAAHGSGSGYGMVKILWKHGEKSPKAGTSKQVTKADILRLPHVLRDIPPEIDNDATTGDPRQWTWNIQRHDGEIVCYAINSFIQDQQRMHVVSIHVHE